MHLKHSKPIVDDCIRRHFSLVCRQEQCRRSNKNLTPAATRNYRQPLRGSGLYHSRRRPRWCARAIQYTHVSSIQILLFREAALHEIYGKSNISAIWSPAMCYLRSCNIFTTFHSIQDVCLGTFVAPLVLRGSNLVPYIRAGFECPITWHLGSHPPQGTFYLFIQQWWHERTFCMYQRLGKGPRGSHLTVTSWSNGWHAIYQYKWAVAQEFGDHPAFTQI